MSDETAAILKDPEVVAVDQDPRGLQGVCLDAYDAGTGNGTSLVLWSCNGGDNQKWSRT